MFKNKEISIGSFSIRGCCTSLKDHALDDPTKRGIHLLPTKNEWGPYLTIHFRSIDKDNELKLKPDYLVSLTSEVAIKFCPWCGKKIQIKSLAG